MRRGTAPATSRSALPFPELVGRRLENLGQDKEVFALWHAPTGLPARHGLAGHTQPGMLSQLQLRHAQLDPMAVDDPTEGPEVLGRAKRLPGRLPRATL